MTDLSNITSKYEHCLSENSHFIIPLYIIFQPFAGFYRQNEYQNARYF